MSRLFAAMVAAGMVGSATFLGGAYASAETAVIVPGTAPSPYPALRALYHFDPASRVAIGENYYDSAGAPRQVVPYPGSLWPLTGKDSPTLGNSVAVGTDNLGATIRDTEGPVAVTGLSQGVLALNAEQARLAHDPSAPPPGDLTFIKAGNPDRLFTKYFRPGTRLPGLDYTVPGAVESQYDTVEIVGQYDIFSDPLDRPGNLVALANALAAGGTNHTATAFSDPAQIAPENVRVTTNSRGATTTTYFLPAEELPLVQLLRDAGISGPMADEMEQVLRPVVARAYGPAPAPVRPALRLPALAHGLPNLAPVTIPINATTNVVSAVNTARVVNQIRQALPKKNKNPLPKIGILPKGKNKKR
ncbi:PE-PPE domain-containing protein [[Mycobacterium] burgundiense]|jgi:hypothetical protein|uniref:PE-PPE domain-containing protein n=1 Tax=[Mycobacterium] burgundiense TaxID=3064286 RepID=A0ABM9LTD4_9MYCO|nr:PE-PPE domain-containing protein [Mycolicibacterium sp. MU0053]CAJ1504385.1 PE-PPE domain-containing protein [Mycolicibacterium sp. MU0053]